MDRSGQLLLAGHGHSLPGNRTEGPAISVSTGMAGRTRKRPIRATESGLVFVAQAKQGQSNIRMEPSRTRTRRNGFRQNQASSVQAAREGGRCSAFSRPAPRRTSVSPAADVGPGSTGEIEPPVPPEWPVKAG
jgi:hypothetical protein